MNTSRVPRVSSLLSYGARGSAGGVRVEWLTGAEIGTAGFDVRARAADGTERHAGFLLARGPSAYAYEDPSPEARSGAATAYRVVERSVSGAEGAATPWLGVSASPDGGGRPRSSGHDGARAEGPAR